MVSRYRLIKEYPGSPKLGHEEYFENSEYYSKNWKGTQFYDKYPEFWEEMVEKEYEVLSVNNNPGGKPRWPIHAVRRLSDGEIFTIGDKLHGYDLGRAVNLTGFKEESGRLLVGHRDLGFIELKNTKKPKVLFTSYDGVDIYEGDGYVMLDKLYWNTSKCIASKYTTTNNLVYLYFSSPEEAEKYLILNKPVLTLNDVYRHIPGGIPFHFADLRKLVEEKIKYRK